MSNNIGKDKSVIQEERVAKLFDGKRTPQSGGGKFRKGDILTKDFLIECKTTIEPKLTYSVKKDTLDKAKHEANEMGKEDSILAFTIGENFEDYFVVSHRFIRKLINLQSDVQNLYNTTKAQLTQIEFMATELTKRHKEISEIDVASFKIHRNRLQFFLEELEKLL